MNRETFQKISASLIFVIRDNKILLGQILGGTIAGFITPPGGKIESKDKNIKASASRELLEETGLIAKSLYEVAVVTIRIPGKRKVILHVFKCTKWSGKLKREEREFSYLKFFPFDKIPWEKTAPGDEEWMRRILFKKEHLQVDVLCGERRIDLREIKIKILP